MKTILLFVAFVLTASAKHAPFVAEIAHTGSMVPTFKGGELKMVRPIAYADLKPGMIAVFKTPSGLIVHRVVRVTPKFFTTKGDANRNFDPLNKPSDLVGVVQE